MELAEYIPQFLNYYECPQCGFHFYDVWECEVNERCDSCGCTDIQPDQSIELPDDGLEGMCVWHGAVEELDPGDYN